MIIKPNKKISQPVTLYSEELLAEIALMRKMLKDQKFENNQKGFAIAHCQISENPVQLFVIHQSISKNDVVVNPELIGAGGRYMATEGCLSFPYSPMTKVRRYKEIIVRYETPDGQQIQETLTGVKAQIFQHEMDHFEGTNIYNK